MSIELIGSRNDRDKLGRIHDGFQKGDITSFVCVSVSVDGTVEVNYDLVDSRHTPLLNKMGGGLLAALQALREMAVEANIANNIVAGKNPYTTN